MSDSGGQQTNSATSSSAPWAAAQPFITDIMGQAQALNNRGQQYAPFNTVAPFSPATQTGLDLTAQRAMNGSPLVNAASTSLQNIMQPRTAPGSDTLQSLLSGYSDPGASYTQAGANATNGAAPMLSSMAGADPNVNPAQRYLGAQAQSQNINPWLEGMFSAASKPVIDAVNAQAGMAGRTGSGADQQLLTRNLGDMASTMYGQNYQNAVNNQMNAANAVQGAFDNGANRNLSAATSLGNLNEAGAQRQLSAGNTLSNNASTQAQLKYGAANALNTNANTQANQSIAASTLAPSIAGQDYTNLQNLLNVGNAYDTQAQNQTNSLLDRWNFGQQNPMNLLKQYASIFSGLPTGQTTSSTGTAQLPSQSPIPQLLGTGVNLLSSNSSNGGSLFSNLLGY